MKSPDRVGHSRKDLLGKTSAAPPPPPSHFFAPPPSLSLSTSMCVCMCVWVFTRLRILYDNKERIEQRRAREDHYVWLLKLKPKHHNLTYFTDYSKASKPLALIVSHLIHIIIYCLLYLQWKVGSIGESFSHIIANDMRFAREILDIYKCIRQYCNWKVDQTVLVNGRPALVMHKIKTSRHWTYCELV